MTPLITRETLLGKTWVCKRLCPYEEQGENWHTGSVRQRLMAEDQSHYKLNSIMGQQQAAHACRAVSRSFSIAERERGEN